MSHTQLQRYTCDRCQEGAITEHYNCLPQGWRELRLTIDCRSFVAFHVCPKCWASFEEWKANGSPVCKAHGVTCTASGRGESCL